MMDYGIKYMKAAFALTVKHFLLVCFLVLIMPIPLYILFKIFPLLSFLYLITVLTYVMSGTKGYLCQHYNDKVSLNLFKNLGNKYYIQYIVTGLLITCWGLLIIIPIGFLLIMAMSIVMPQPDSATLKMIGQLLMGVVVTTLFVYVFPFLFVYDVKAGSVVKHGVRYFKFIILNKRNEFLALFLLILTSLTAEVAYKANFNVGTPAIWIGSRIIKNYIDLLIFLTAAIQLMSDPKAKETVGIIDKDIIGEPQSKGAV